jgi:hypothetical protein
VLATDAGVAAGPTIGVVVLQVDARIAAAGGSYAQRIAAAAAARDLTGERVAAPPGVVAFAALALLVRVTTRRASRDRRRHLEQRPQREQHRDHGQ